MRGVMCPNSVLVRGAVLGLVMSTGGLPFAHAQMKPSSSPAAARKESVPAAGPTFSRWARPWPQGNTLNSVWIAPWGDVFCVGDGGTLMQSSDQGEHWDIRQLGELKLNAVWGLGDDSVFIVGDRGTIYASRDCGRNFAAVSSGTTSDLLEINGRGKDVYIAASNTLLHSPDSGNAWITHLVKPATPGFAGSPGYVSSANSLLSVAVGDNDEVVAIANGGAIYISSNHGRTWKQQKFTAQSLGLPEQEQLEFQKIIAHQGQFLILTYAGVPSGGILPTASFSPIVSWADGKLSPWIVRESTGEPVDASLQNRPTPNASFTVDGAGAVVVVGATERRAWAAVDDRELRSVPIKGERPEGTDVFTEVASDAHSIFAVGSYGLLQRSLDHGKTWQELRTPRVSFQSAWAASGRALAVGREVWASEDNGASWQALVTDRKECDGAVAAYWAGKDLRMLGRFGLKESHDGGKTWSKETMVDDKRFRAEAAWISGQGEPYIAASLFGTHGCAGSGVVRSVKGELEQAKLDTAPEGCGLITAIHGNSEGFVYAAGSAGNFFRSKDAGAKFENNRWATPMRSVTAVHAGKGQNVWVLTQPDRGGYSPPRLEFSGNAGKNFSVFPAPRSTGPITAIGGSTAGEIVVAQEGHIYERAIGASSWTELTSGVIVGSAPITALAVPEPRHVIAVGKHGAIIEVKNR